MIVYDGIRWYMMVYDGDVDGLIQYVNMFHQEDGDACKWSLCIVMLRHAKTIIRKTRWDLPRSQKLRKVWK